MDQAQAFQYTEQPIPKVYYIFAIGWRWCTLEKILQGSLVCICQKDIVCAGPYKASKESNNVWAWFATDPEPLERADFVIIVCVCPAVSVRLENIDVWSWIIRRLS